MTNSFANQVSTSYATAEDLCKRENIEIIAQSIPQRRNADLDDLERAICDNGVTQFGVDHPIRHAISFINSKLTSASSVIDGYIRTRYPAAQAGYRAASQVLIDQYSDANNGEGPLNLIRIPAGDNAALLADICAAIACWELIGGDVDSERYRAYKEAYRKLEGIADGTLTLAIEAQPPEAGTGAKVQSATAVWGRDKSY